MHTLQCRAKQQGKAKLSKAKQQASASNVVTSADTFLHSPEIQQQAWILSDSIAALHAAGFQPPLFAVTKINSRRLLPFLGVLDGIPREAHARPPPVTSSPVTSRLFTAYASRFGGGLGLATSVAMPSAEHVLTRIALCSRAAVHLDVRTAIEKSQNVREASER